MQLTVDGVSKTGKGFISDKTWYNRGKNYKGPDFSSLSRGTEVEVTLSEGTTFVNSLSVIGAEEIPTEPKKTPEPQAKKEWKEDPAKAQSISRMAATKTAAELVKNIKGDYSEQVSEFKSLSEKIHLYHTTGKFGE